MNILHERFTITASDGEQMYLDARVPENSERFPVIVVAHGFKGFKDWGFFPYVCETLASQGFYVINFNFTHNGVEANGVDFDRLDKFAENSFTRENRELREVIDAVCDGRVPYPERLDSDRLTTLGHSRGGGAVILEATDDPRVGMVVSWAGVSTFKRYTEAQRERWRREGFLEAKNSRTGQMMRLNVSLLDDLESNEEALDIVAAAARLGRPLLIAHGEVDLSVEITNGERLAAAGDPAMTEFVRIPRTGHTFGAVHPFQGTSEALENVITATVRFIRFHQHSPENSDR